MIQYSAALRMVLSRPLELGTESCPLLRSVGRVLARDFAAPESLPRYTYSAMDGFAALARSVRGASSESPVFLEVIGESRPGHPYDGPKIRPGQAIAIATGAEIPDGANAIIPVEWTFTGDPVLIGVNRVPKTRDYFRRAGGDVKKGRHLLPKGRLIDAASLAVIAQFGIDTIEVFRRPRIAVLTSGDELVPLGRPVGGDRIVPTNLYYTSDSLAAFGCNARNFGIAPDRMVSVRRLLARAVEWSDMVITIAGVSAGKRDFIPAALQDIGAKILFHGVAIKPGKPVLFARVGDKPVFALPGNPLSAACGVEVFVKPFLRASFGASSPLPQRGEAPLARPVPRDRRRLTFLFSRIRWTPSGPLVDTPGKQESGNLSLLAGADCLAEVPSGEGQSPAGTLVRIWPLR